MFYLYRVSVDGVIDYVVTEDWNLPGGAIVDTGNKKSLNLLRKDLLATIGIERECIEAYFSGERERREASRE